MAATSVEFISHQENECPFCHYVLADSRESVIDEWWAGTSETPCWEVERSCPECSEIFYNRYDLSYRDTYYPATIL